MAVQDTSTCWDLYSVDSYRDLTKFSFFLFFFFFNFQRSIDFFFFFSLVEPFSLPLLLTLHPLLVSPVYLFLMGFKSDKDDENVELKPLSGSNNTPSARFCTLSVEETVAQLHTSATNGLDSPQDVNYRKSVHGLNELTGEEEDSLIKKFLMQFYENPLILLLVGSALISFVMGNRDDAISITLAILIVITVGFVQEYKSEKSLEALSRLVPPSCHLTRGANNTQTVLASNLVPGDLVHFNVGDRIPADIRLTEAHHLEIDESNLTGEAQPASKSTEAIIPPGSDASNPLSSHFNGNIPIVERHNIAYMGTLTCNGRGSGIVVGTGRDTEFGTVFGMMDEIDKPKTPLQVSMDKLGKELSLMSFGVIGLICLVGVIQGRSWLDMFTISVSLAVAAIPEGLPIIVTVTLALGVLRMADEKAIMRRLPSVETLGSVNVICTDKTGTLTMNKMTLTKLWTVDMGDTKDKGPKPWVSISENIHDETVTKVDDSVVELLKTGTLCTTAMFSTDTNKYVGNPVDIALLESLKRFDMEDLRSTRSITGQIPFSSSRKWMAISSHTGDKSVSTVYTKGAMTKILPACTQYVTKTGELAPLDDEHRKIVINIEKKMASEGLRILAMAYGSDKGDMIKSQELKDMVFTGLVGMYDPPRPGVQGAIQKLMRGGVRVIMITGDSEATGESIARQIGIPLTAGEKSVMNGDELERLTTEELANAMNYVSVFARTSPENKMIIVRALQARGDIVGMTGDGVNDAPALKLADIGISMGQSGTDVAKEASDMILVDDDFPTILSAIKEGKSIFTNIQSFLKFQLSTSAAALSLVSISTLFGLPTPLNAMQILWINIIMDGPPAQSLGVEPVDPSVMNKPPRSRNDHVLTKQVIKRVLQSALIVLLGTLWVYRSEMKDGVVTARDTTMTFTCFVFFDMFNALASRSATKSVFEIGIFSNQMFNLSVGGSILGQLAVIYLPFFQGIFQTEALSFGDLVYLVALTSSVWWFEELRKYWAKRTAVNLGGYSSNV